MSERLVPLRARNRVGPYYSRRISAGAARPREFRGHLSAARRRRDASGSENRGRALMRGCAALVLLAVTLPAAAGEFRSIAENGTPMYDGPSARAKKLFVASRYYPVEIVVTLDPWVK